MIKSEQKITFISDGLLLKGILHMPAVAKPPVVIGSHGLLSNSNSPKQIELARHCNKCDIAYFRFDHRGCGESSGVFQEVTTLEARRKDLLCAISAMKKRKDVKNRFGLFGSSLGGAVCLSVGNRSDVNVIITFAAPVNSRSIADTANKYDNQAPHEHLFYKKNLRFDISDKLSGICNILILHGDQDAIVPPSHARKIYRAADQPKKLVMQKQGDHLMNNKDHQVEFIKEAVAWFKSFL